MKNNKNSKARFIHISNTKRKNFSLYLKWLGLALLIFFIFEMFYRRVQKNHATPPFPIDLVYTWVDGRDSRWVSLFQQTAKRHKIEYGRGTFEKRFVDLQELRFSLRSVEKFASFINKIYIVTMNQVPSWINRNRTFIPFTILNDKDLNSTDGFQESGNGNRMNQIFIEMLHQQYQERNANKIKKIYDQFRKKMEKPKTNFPEIIFVSHNDIFPNDALPTFNSKAIDFSISNIPNLSEHFIYMNDDMFFGQKVGYNFFFQKDGKPKWLYGIRNFTDFRNEYNKIMTSNERYDNGAKMYTASYLGTILKFEKKFGRFSIFDRPHVAFPLTKSICKEVSEAFAKDIHETIFSKFRQASNLQMQTLMFQYGIHTHQAVLVDDDPNKSDFFIANIPSSLKKMGIRLYSKMPIVFCINIERDQYRGKIVAFLDRLFPRPSFYEHENVDRIEIDFKDYYFWKRRKNFFPNSEHCHIYNLLFNY
ncbi:hypothetical protein TRFO_29680 [Tritrichomonas foetus]|uniref:Stealth protein CR2 conserved region 2 domain-containing protein n=1 Tax=Tritrichomonas foetus TaxID=1144522 RepID=A0A1J4JX35_9EUKA|nr:hypothetical protein TRFO_29680 [Tritrichomonas foetus]|eukprot:OHT03024.1 hypothetical protein TRFO_29680 [Tritrichomonas foetus]